jgi:PTH2 family peptidyl-tRNA hydrolase
MKAILDYPNHPNTKLWLADKFTKIVVRVESEQELFDIYNKAQAAKLIVSLIQDAGLTEFGGVPTYTCIAIGPAKDEELGPITGHLKLL